MRPTEMPADQSRITCSDNFWARCANSFFQPRRQLLQISASNTVNNFSRTTSVLLRIDRDVAAWHLNVCTSTERNQAQCKLITCESLSSIACHWTTAIPSMQSSLAEQCYRSNGVSKLTNDLMWNPLSKCKVWFTPKINEPPPPRPEPFFETIRQKLSNT